LAHDSAYSPLFIQFPRTKIYSPFFVIVQYETYADHFVRLCEIYYLMSVFTSFKMLLIRKVKYV